MEFYKYIDSWSFLKKHNLRQHFSSKSEFLDFKKQWAEENESPFTYRRAILEEGWDTYKNPYYNCYPAILPMLMKLKLNIPWASMDFSKLGVLEVRLPKNQSPESPFKWGEHEVRSIMFGVQDMVGDQNTSDLIKGLCICFDIGEVDCLGLEPVYSFRLLPFREGFSVEESLSVLSVDKSALIGVVVPEEIALNVIKLCVCLALLDSDPSIITPDILSSDRDKWQGASDAERERLIEKAKRRGKNGWNVGASIEYIPHYRRPHPALVRIGKGRMLSRIVMRKGSVVHRSKLTEIPSGYENKSD